VLTAPLPCRAAQTLKPAFAQPVADAAALAAVAGSRVRFLCLDACSTHVALGASTGRRVPLALFACVRNLR
jgi:hypothetical protein